MACLVISGDADIMHSYLKIKFFEVLTTKVYFCLDRAVNCSRTFITTGPDIASVMFSGLWILHTILKQVFARFLWTCTIKQITPIHVCLRSTSFTSFFGSTIMQWNKGLFIENMILMSSLLKMGLVQKFINLQIELHSTKNSVLFRKRAAPLCSQRDKW